MINANLTDICNIISRLTFKKAWNAVRLISSYYIAKQIKKPLHLGMPMSIAIEPTTACNLRCPECPSGLRAFTRPTGKLELTTFRSIIDQLTDHLLYLTFYFQGEPYLHPHFLDMVSYAAQKKIYTATSTNAHFLNDESARQTVVSGLDRLIISVDGTSQQTYQSYRVGGKLARVLEGAKNIIAWKKKLQSTKPYIVFQFLVIKTNEHQIPQLYRLAEKLGVHSVVLKTAQIYNYENGSPLIPLQNRYSRYEQQPNGTYAIKNQLKNGCWKMWHSCVITWDGRVLPCCFDKDAHYELGDLKDTAFETIWKSHTYKNFRKQLILARQHVDICKNCTEGTKVWA